MKRISVCYLAFTLLLLANSYVVAKIECIEPNKATGSSKAVVVDGDLDLAHTAQFFPLNKQGEVVHKGDVRKQTEVVLATLGAKVGGAKLDRVVRLNVYVARSELAAAVSEVLAKEFSGETKPAVTFVGGDLLYPEALVAMDAVAISTVQSPSPMHFHEKGSRFSYLTVLPQGGAVYVAGLAGKGDLASATRETMGKIQDAISHLGLEKHQIVQLKAFVTPITQADVVKGEIEKFFGKASVPPIIYVDWISSGVPVEIEAIVSAPASVSEKTVTYHTPPGTSASPVYSRLARIHSGKRIYLSSLYGKREPAKDVMDIYEQLDEILAKTGSSRDHLVKATYYFSDPQSNGRLDAFRPKYYSPKTPPAASKAKVKDVGQEGKGIVIDMIGVTK